MTNGLVGSIPYNSKSKDDFCLCFNFARECDPNRCIGCCGNQDLFSHSQTA